MSDAKKDAKNFKKNAFVDNEVQPEEFCEKICRKTSDYLKELQKEFGKLVKDKEEKDGQPLALTKFIRNNLENCKIEAQGKKSVKIFLERVLRDPYLRKDPSDMRETSTKKNYNIDETQLNLEKLSAQQYVDLFLSADKDDGRAMNFCQIKKIVGDTDLAATFNTNIAGALQPMFKAYIDFAKEKGPNMSS